MRRCQSDRFQFRPTLLGNSSVDLQGDAIELPGRRLATEVDRRRRLIRRGNRMPASFLVNTFVLGKALSFNKAVA
jgi:hypothetical protein